MPPDDFDFGASDKKTSADLGEDKQGQIFEEPAITVSADSPNRKYILVGFAALAVAAVVVLAVMALGSGSDDESSISQSTDPGPGAIPQQTIPAKPDPEQREDPDPRPSIPPIPIPNTIQPADGPPISGLATTDGQQVRFVAEQWVGFAQRNNLGAFCIFMSDRFRAQLTADTGVQSLSKCVQGNFRKFTLGAGLLPLKSIRGAGRVARVTYGRGQVATLRKQDNNTWKIDAFRR